VDEKAFDLRRLARYAKGMKNLLFFALCLLTTAARAELPLGKIRLPPGFEIETYATGVKGARSLAWGPHGILFIGARDAGKVYALTPDHKLHTLAKNLNMPNGVAFREGSLYVAEVSRVLRYDKIEANLDHPPAPVVVIKNLPADESHGWKFIAFGPDGMLYIPVGAPCNICEPKDPYASILRFRPDGGGREIFSRGIRNSVGFDWHPLTHELWFTDNGRDLLGDDLPPDELNRAPRPGMHFGYPYCHGGDTPDPELGRGKSCADYTPPAQKLGAHVAALGMRFYTGSAFPAEFRNQIFIAEHGSWNRTSKSGYRIAVVKVDGNGRALSYKPFAEGWLQGETNWGRPVDVLVAPDGSLLVSDDFAGAVYRIWYKP
jgi:glucose/arabinose dehydrogenase